MHTITFISTIHKEVGKCNSNELCSILEEIRPEVIFLEALENSYTDYQHNNFIKYGVRHKKLELSAIQKLNRIIPFKYVPVLDIELPDSFEIKYDILSRFSKFQALLNEINSMIEEGGFAFLNSKECSDQNKKMREIESHLLDYVELENLVNDAIEDYENSMIRNINSYCKSNAFDKAVFMCGVAHRSSIINKIENLINDENLNINWQIYGT